ncbi:uncharacterized protein METZ01_LOCUS279612, partial [marine metagenome]
PERQRLVVTENQGDFLLIKPNNKHIVGQVRIGETLFVVNPRFDNSLFTRFLVFSTGRGGSKNQLLKRKGQMEITDAFRESPLRALAWLMIESAEWHLPRQQVRRSYIEKRERLQLLKGRPLWNQDFGGNPAMGITCRYYELDTHDLLNRCIYHGIKAASSILQMETSEDSDAELSDLAMRANSLEFEWQGMAGGSRPQLDEYWVAKTRISRSNYHYAEPLSIAQCIVYDQELNLFEDGLETGCIQWEMSRLFEFFLEGVVSGWLDESPVEVSVKAQDYEKNDINVTSPSGVEKTYHGTFRDLVLRGSDSMPVGLIDAKYKPKYLNRLADGSWVGVGRIDSLSQLSKKISNADLYQLFFYQLSLMRRWNQENPENCLELPSAIVAPLFGGEAPPRWMRDLTLPGESRVELIPIDI